MWHHVALTSTGTLQTLYLDGDSVGTLSGTVNNLDMTYNQIGYGWTLGWPYAGTSGWSSFPGSIDDVAITNTALSAASVAARVAPAPTSTTLAPTYDSHGNTLTLGGETYGWDSSDRHVTTQVPSTGTITYTRDALDRIVARTTSNVPNSITYVGQTNNNSGGSSTSSITLTKPTGVQNNDVLIATIATGSAATVTTPSGWTQVDSEANGSSLRTTVLRRVAQASDTSWVFNLSASVKNAGGIAAYRGVDTTNPIDGADAKSASGSSTSTHTAPAVTTTITN
jgi:hypothetical protein